MTDAQERHEHPGPRPEWEESLVRTRAYEIWEREGRPEGRQLEHWTQAERELADEEEATLRLAEGEFSSLGEAD